MRIVVGFTRAGMLLALRPLPFWWAEGVYNGQVVGLKRTRLQLVNHALSTGFLGLSAPSPLPTPYHFATLPFWTVH